MHPALKGHSQDQSRSSRPSARPSARHRRDASRLPVRRGPAAGTKDAQQHPRRLGKPGSRPEIIGDVGPRLGNRERSADTDGSDEGAERSEEHTSELQSLMRTSYAVFCLKKKTTINATHIQK